MQWLKLRAPEWIAVGFFAYLCILIPFFPDRPHLRGYAMPLLLLAVSMSCALLARLQQTRCAIAITFLRDAYPFFLALLAFWSMERFLPPQYDVVNQRIWIQWDRLVLLKWHVQAFIESTGPLLPGFFELCYLLVYGLPFYCLALLYAQQRQRGINAFVCVYLAGTLTAYGLFPFFPTEPPRLAFPDVAMPNVVTIFRQANLAILHAGTIHVGVFPSAHVSSAFAAAFGLFLVLPDRKRYGFIALGYALCVAIAVVYGRYHYVVDVVSGFAVGLLAGVVALAIHRFSRSRRLQP